MYALEAFNLLGQTMATLTPRQAHRLVWNRTVNTRGGMSDLNREFKDDSNTFRANISEKSIARSSQAIAPMSDLMKKVDAITHVKSPSGHHVGPSIDKDFSTVLKLLLKEQIFERQPGRYHSEFKAISANPLEKLENNYDKLHAWLLIRRREATTEFELLHQVFSHHKDQDTN